MKFRDRSKFRKIFVVFLFLISTFVFSALAVGWTRGGEFAFFSTKSVGAGFNFPESKNHSKKYRITACALFGQEQQYAVEWIEFHRRQGYDKFVFYYDAPPQDHELVEHVFFLHLLMAFYADNGHPDLIEAIPAMSLVPDLQGSLRGMRRQTRQVHLLLQPAVNSHCLERYRRDSSWIAFHDLDEFLHAPKFDSVWDFIRNSNATGYNVDLVNYGPAGNIWNYHNDITADLSKGNLQLTFDPRDSSSFMLNSNDNDKKNFNTKYVNDSLNHFDPRDNLDRFRLLRFKEIDEFLAVLNDEKMTPEDKLWRLQALENSRYDSEETSANMDLRPPSYRNKNAFIARHESRDQLLDDWSDYYPLVTEEQVRRLPSLESENDKKLIGAYFLSECRDFFSRPDWKEDEVPGQCKGKLPSDGFTQMGKTLYNMDYPVDGCRRPWIHFCSEFYKTPVRADVHEELRLDHHQFPGIEKRTLRQTRWRKTKEIYGLENYSGLLKAMSSIHDDSKLRFVEDIRNQIRRYKPLPRWKSMSLELHHRRKSFKSTYVDKVSKCSPVEVYTGHKMLCPEEFPRVGFWKTKSFLSSQDSPYNWCTNITEDFDMDGTMKVKKQNFIDCPGYPDVSCCDYESGFDQKMN